MLDDATKATDAVMIIKNKYSRGMQIEACEDKIIDCQKDDEIGLQYTLKDEKTAEKHKRSRINSVKEREDYE
jgi:hypothetical protein